MPPKKLIKKLVNNGEPKSLRSRTKKNNVKINTPEFKVTIPLQNVPIAFENQPQVETPMPGKNDIKIMLANEVVRRQFPKKKTLIEEPNGLLSKVDNTSKTIKKNPLIRQRKLLPKDKNSEVTKKNPQGKCRRRVVAKNNTNVFESEPCNKQLEIKEAAADEKIKETKKPVKLRRNRITQKSAPLPPAIVTDDNKVKEIKNHPASPNAVLKRKIGPRPGPRTRKKANEAKETQNTQTEINESQKNIICTENVLNTRRLSVAGSELSWTKDISSSSTSTCVTVSSKDFFCIDNKIPFIKLTNIDKQLKSDELNENDKQENRNIELLEDGVKTVDLQLSSSSSSSSSSDQEQCQDVQNTQALTILDKLASKLKNFDIEIMNWIGYSEQTKSNDLNKIQDKVFNDSFLHEEREVMLHCQSILRILSEYSHRDEGEKENCHNHIEVNVETNNNISDNTKESTVKNSEQNTDNVEVKPNQIEEKVAHTSAYNDEDDALSLYAESITDMESPRNWSQRSRENIEEYVPLPATEDVFKRPEKVIYKPTKIKKISKEPENPMEIGICEKSNADSTSMYKDNNESACDENAVFYEDRLGEVVKPLESPIQNESILMAINQKPKQGIHSAVFKGICIFNLTTNCKNVICKFPHKILDKDDIRLRLRKLDDQLFLEEYVFLRTWPSLRRLYSICFLEDCIRRKLTRVLIEMTLDLVNKSYSKEDGILGVEAIETTLVYLNDIELHAYSDLLKYKVKSNRLLCDVFMDTIAKSQNFSRFKPIFINLTDFMCKLESSFEMDMASHVLERVCILPFEFNLARALVQVIKNTDLNILSNSMMKHFEKQLLYSSTDLYEEFRAFKELNSKSLRDANCFNSPLDSDSERMNNHSYSENDIRYSPDTTNLDNYTKSTIEPKFKRTVDLKKLQVFNDIPNSSSSESDDKYTYRHYKTWKNSTQRNNRQSIHRNTMEGRIHMRPPLRPAFKRRSDQNFGSSPNKFPRRSGPTFF